MKYAAAVAAAQSAGARLPVWTGEVPPSVWAQTWTDRPTEPIQLGLRTLSEQDLGECTALADQRSRRLHPDAREGDELLVSAYDRALVRFALARALCSPESADVPFWEYSDIVALARFEDAGAKWLYTELMVATVKASPLGGAEDPLTVHAALGELLTDRALALPIARRYQVTRLLAAALDIVSGG